MGDLVPEGIDHTNLSAKIAKITLASSIDLDVVGDVLQEINHYSCAASGKNCTPNIVRNSGVMNEYPVKLRLNVGPQKEKFTQGAIEALALLFKFWRHRRDYI